MVEPTIPTDVVESPDQRRRGYPFRSGSVVLDFVATVAKRDIADRELLTSPAALVEWTYVAGLPSITEQVTADDLREAHDLREALNRLTRCRIRDSSPQPVDVNTVNHHARSLPAHRELTSAGDATVDGAPVDAAAILAVIAIEAVELFGGKTRDRIRLCAGHDCSLYFVDRSRLGNRMWCSMAVCGVKNSSARYRSRRRSLV